MQNVFLGFCSLAIGIAATTLLILAIKVFKDK